MIAAVEAAVVPGVCSDECAIAIRAAEDIFAVFADGENARSLSVYNEQDGSSLAHSFANVIEREERER